MFVYSILSGTNGPIVVASTHVLARTIEVTAQVIDLPLTKSQQSIADSGLREVIR
jgi:hypothetical protein